MEYTPYYISLDIDTKALHRLYAKLDEETRYWELTVSKAKNGLSHIRLAINGAYTGYFRNLIDEVCNND